MKKFALLMALSLAFACGDDSTDSNNGNNANTNNGATNNANNSNNITTNNANNVSDMGVVSDAGADMAGGDDMAGGEDAGGDMTGGVDMAPDMAMAYQWPATADDYASSVVANTYLNSLVLPELDQNDEPTCCKDFGARSLNSGLDNAVAQLDSLLAPVGVSLSASLELAIEQGDLIVLLDHRELESADDADGFVLSWVNGEFAQGTDYTLADAGNGQFLIDAASFVPGTGEPLVNFDPASMTAGVMSGGPTTGAIVFPIGTLLINVTLQEAEIAGNATLSMDGVAYTQGTVSGYILLSDIMNGLNEIAASPACSCLGLTGPLYEQDASGDWSGNCVSNTASLCPDVSQQTCRLIAGDSFSSGEICTTLPILLPGQTDIDSNGDSEYDSLSIGLEWTGVNAEITGVAN